LWNEHGDDLDLGIDYYSGVDLNRNYGYKFGIDNVGSSDDPCD